MKNLNNYITEKLKINKDVKVNSLLDDEMEEWDERMKSPFGKVLKELQCAVIDSGLYPVSKNEYGLNVYTPFDNYITAYALDGNNEFTYKAIKEICDYYDYTDDLNIKKTLNKLKKLV